MVLSPSIFLNEVMRPPVAWTLYRAPRVLRAAQTRTTLDGGRGRGGHEPGVAAPCRRGAWNLCGLSPRKSARHAFKVGTHRAPRFGRIVGGDRLQDAAVIGQGLLAQLLGLE